ncbi:MAG TPA: hypothetical protein VE954_27010 [Oligoflexus sp.]|uniref:hypothetical protein n=1 Tax=Oligoflexus sp. TaxID=1971216 RepID=UPI002D2EA634|nr:hypothetical protein [Oligoflexus sp.]HYX36774.1 hypothetical protein [Oligoflexus sp.]
MVKFKIQYKNLAIFLCWLLEPTILRAEDSRHIEIRLSTQGNDIAFDKKYIEEAYAPEIKIKFFNKALPGSQILHNIAILKPGEVEAVIHDMQKLGYDLEKLKQHKSILVMTQALDPEVAEVVTLRAPGKGYYPYICLMAGHGDILEMRGILHLK